MGGSTPPSCPHYMRGTYSLLGFCVRGETGCEGDHIAHCIHSVGVSQDFAVEVVVFVVERVCPLPCGTRWACFPTGS